tara:strand:- start:283 stop:1389 length:1107 start_codon:yes stop_codon:yes gene_type:complete
MKKRNLKIFDLTKQYKSISKEINLKIIKVLGKGQYILGKNVTDFEKRFANKSGVNHAIACNSGTDALLFALKCLNIKKGDEVITTPFTYFATAEVVIQCGAKPVFVDINPLTFNIDYDLIERAITKRTKAIMPVHIFGQSSNMPKIKKIAYNYNLKLIEDCAQSIGSTYNKTPSGTFGDFGCFSFFPTKNLGAFGDAGIVITSKQHYAEKIRKLRNHGSIVRNEHEIIGFNSRMDEIQAAVLNIKLKYLNKYNKKRNQIAKLYKSLIKNQLITLPYKDDNVYHVYHQYTLCVKKREKFIKHLSNYNIPFGIYYPKPLYRQRALKNLCSSKKLLNAEKVTKECISIPIYPELDYDSVEYIASIINQYKL